MNKQTVTVKEAYQRKLYEFDDPILTWGEGECSFGQAHVVGEILYSAYEPTGAIMRCCCCGKEYRPNDDCILAVQHSADDELEPADA